MTNDLDHLLEQVEDALEDGDVRICAIWPIRMKSAIPSFLAADADARTSLS